MIAALKTALIHDEGLKLKPYRDTEGKLTIGVGRNLEALGISEEEAMVLLSNDIDWVMSELDSALSWWRLKPLPVQCGMANMMFNMGYPKFSGFNRMLTALKNDDFEAAANEALQSKWAAQVGRRADRIADLFRSAINTKENKDA